MKKKLEDKGLCGGVRKYMSGEKIAGHRRTSRTVCHRLVTPLPTSFVKRRGVAGRQARDKRMESYKKCAEVLQTRP